MLNNNRKKFQLLLILVLLLAGCVPSQVPLAENAQADPVVPPDASSGTAVAREMADPEAAAAVAVDFYTAYLASLRHTGPDFSSPEFPKSQYLSSDYLRQLDEIEAGFEGYGFLPILQTQTDLPDPLEVKETNIEGYEATVILQFGRGIIDPPFERVVSLDKIDGQWKIVPDRLEGPVLNAEETVQEFYDGYLSQAATGGPGNMLSNRAYRDSPYLSAALVRDVDLLVEQAGGPGFDPFLCAQDLPESIKVTSSFENAMRPIVVVESSFPGHTLVLDLVRANFNRWTIETITCGRSYQGAAKSFFTWALGYINAEEGTRNPWTDGAYQDSPYLSQAMINELDARLASGEPLEADPVMFSQAVPQALHTTACPHDQPCAYVDLQYGDATIRRLRADFQTEAGLPKIINITPFPELEIPQPDPSPTAEDYWVPLIDQQYGFALRFPRSWRVDGLHVNQLSTAEENPVRRSLSLYSPNIPQDFATLRIEVFAGDEGQVTASYQLDKPLEEFEIQGSRGVLYLVEPGIIRAVIRHPARPEQWIILEDLVSQFPGREAYASTANGVLSAVLMTIVFGE